MKKIIIFSSLFFLIIATALTKNSTKNIDSQIFNLREDLRILKDKYELVFLDYNFLSSPEKLLEYQKRFFENDLVAPDIKNFKKIYFNNNQVVIDEIIEMDNINEKNWKGRFNIGGL